jgi:hypothetical protein
MNIAKKTVDEAVRKGFSESNLCEDYALVAEDLWEMGIDVVMEEEIYDAEDRDEIIESAQEFIQQMKGKVTETHFAFINGREFVYVR